MGARKTPRAAVARFNSILLSLDGIWIQGGSKTPGKEPKKEQIWGFFPGPQQLWWLFEAQQWQPKPQMLLPCLDAGGGIGSGHHLPPLSTHVQGEQGLLCPR